jgi:hypothetical protein
MKASTLDFLANMKGLTQTQAMASVGFLAIDNPEAAALMNSAQALHQEHDRRAAEQQRQNKKVITESPKVNPYPANFKNDKSILQFPGTDSGGIQSPQHLPNAGRQQVPALPEPDIRKC